MAAEIKILVLMSSYNGEKYITQQIESIMDQTIANRIHLRIRDDGSTDHTCHIIDELSRRFPGKIELIRGKNKGYNKSFFELLFGAGNYDFYSICDQDDVWLPSKLEIAVKCLLQEDMNMPLLYASTSFLAKDDMIPYGQTRKKRKAFSIYNTAIQNICPGHTQVFNHALLEIIQSESVNSDRVYVYDSWITNYAMLYGKIIFNNSSFTCYRQHEDNQLGNGAGIIGRLLTSARRLQTEDGHKYRRQLEYFVEKNRIELNRQGYYNELQKFLNAETLLQKIRYVISSRLYRQNSCETFAFYMAVLIGKY